MELTNDNNYDQFNIIYDQLKFIIEVNKNLKDKFIKVDGLKDEEKNRILNVDKEIMNIVLESLEMATGWKYVFGLKLRVAKYGEVSMPYYFTDNKTHKILMKIQDINIELKYIDNILQLKSTFLEKIKKKYFWFNFINIQC